MTARMVPFSFPLPSPPPTSAPPSVNPVVLRGPRRLAVIAEHLLPSSCTRQLSCTQLNAGSCAGLSRREVNWAGTVRYGAKQLVRPRSLEELCAVIRDAPGTVRVVGRGHSFSPVSVPDGGTLVSLMQMSDVVSYVPPQGRGTFGSVTFQGGATLTDLSEFLLEQSPPAALPQIPSPLFVTAVGALATGTHGSGIRNRTLASFATAVELVTADGSVVHYDCDTNPEEMRGAVMASGCLGAISRMSMQVVPAFDVQIFRHWMPLDLLLEHWAGIYAESDGGPLLCDSATTWVNWQTGIAQVNTRHFVPHYDPRIEAKAPCWGDHPWHKTARRWNILAERGADFATTSRAIGVYLEGGVVKRVEPASMAFGAGVSVGWRIVRMAKGSAPAGSRGPGPIEGAVELKPSISQSELEAAFGELPRDDRRGPVRHGMEPKVMFTFEAPDAKGVAEPGSLTAIPDNEAWYGPSYDILPVWPLGNACPPGPETDYGQQAEYFVPVRDSVAAIRAVWEVLRPLSLCEPEISPVVTQILGEDGYDLGETGVCGLGELRCVRGDDAWLSPSGCDSVSIHVNFSGHARHLSAIEHEHMPRLEAALEPFNTRFHWGKLHRPAFYAPKLSALYGEGLQKFRALARKLDPHGKFRNGWAQELIFADDSSTS
eukprot:TRINITY_DN29160_c0_g1_i1.p1 TRINITY_DN29160_c0_g1~~TRINITY_DN29160_c0_g1_i1.p1  ORF type:complete len:656 (+),score=68.59 TRINITY_DN29160_c0_g1_i1:58-2025(+)